MDYKEELRKYQEIIVQNYDKYWTPRFLEMKEKPHKFRKIGVNEVVWDIDHISKELSHQICDFTSSKLCNDKISHRIFATPRTNHIHAFFDEMIFYPKEFRKKIREEIVKHYSEEYYYFMDTQVFSENKTIRDFNAQHEKVDGIKHMIYEALFNKPNKILHEIISKSKNKFTKKEYTEPKITQKFNTNDLNEILNYKGIFKKGNRNAILFKNIVAMVIKLPENERNEIYNNILKKCPDMKINEFYGWEKYFTDRMGHGITPYFNHKEIKKCL